MNFEQVLNCVATYGLGSVLAVGIAFFLRWILIFVLKENSKREDRLANIIETHIKTLANSVMNVTNSVGLIGTQLNEVKERQHMEQQTHKDIVEVLQLMKTELSTVASILERSR